MPPGHRRRSAGGRATLAAVRLVIARCTVDYDGRLQAHLPSAVRLIMVKADGCVAVHADGGAYKPLNWMNAPNRLVIDTDAGVWRVSAPGRSDSLVITIEEILHDSTHEMGNDPGLQKQGVEAQMQELLAHNPGAIGDGFTLVRREWEVPGAYPFGSSEVVPMRAGAMVRWRLAG